MIKYVNPNTIQENGKCLDVGEGTNTERYKAFGMVERDVEKSEIDNCWYLTEKCPHYTDEEKLEKAKTEKLVELTSITSKFDNQLVNTDMIIKSSLGFSINADLRSQNNLKGLIAVGVEPVNFMTADNSVQSLTLEQLNTLLNECALNGQSLYLQKWAYKARIENAQTKEELEAIELKFTMKDFS